MNEEIYQQIRSIFSEEGFSNGAFNIKVKDELCIDVNCEKDHIDIDFTESPELPELSIKISNAEVDGITLGKRGGKIRLKSLPDLPFLYKWIQTDENE
jgi:hypothetical protein